MYNEKIIDHYENPRNVGSLDKNSPNVGTGIVGAPECFSGNTQVATANGRKTIKQIYDSRELVQVWSFNLKTNQFEIKKAIAVRSKKKRMDNVYLSNGDFVTVTPDHKFFIRASHEYKLNADISDDFIGDYQIVGRSYSGVYDAYTLQVEENNNYVVLPRSAKNVHEGIVVKNCGDVMKLQIQIDETGKIIDSKFKTFGCGSAIASSSLATEWLKGRTLDQAAEIKNTEIVRELALPPVKIHCSVLAEDAIRAAIRDVKEKQSKTQESKQ